MIVGDGELPELPIRNLTEAEITEIRGEPGRGRRGRPGFLRSAGSISSNGPARRTIPERATNALSPQSPKVAADGVGGPSLLSEWVANVRQLSRTILNRCGLRRQQFNIGHDHEGFGVEKPVCAPWKYASFRRISVCCRPRWRTHWRSSSSSRAFGQRRRQGASR